MNSILIVSEAFTAGGLETHIRGEIEYLSRQGWSIHLACGEQFSVDLLPEVTTSVRPGLLLGPNATLAELKKGILDLRELMRTLRVDIVHIHPYTSLIPAAIAAEAEGIPSVITVHGPSMMDGTYGPLFDFLLDHIVLPSARHVFAVSEEVRALLSPFLDSHRLTVLPNSVLLTNWEESPQAGCREDACWLVASRLDHAKLPGVIAFVQMAHAAGIPRIEVAGDGPARGDLQIALRDAGLDEFAALIGFKADLPALMRSYAGVAGMGRVVLESLAAERPTCLIGYDGVKGLVTPRLFEHAAWSNFSGRGLMNITHEQFIQQLNELSATPLLTLGRLMEEEHNELVTWKTFCDIAEQLEPPEKGFLSELSLWLGVQSRPEAEPYLNSQQLGHFVGKLAVSPKYQGRGLANAFLHTMCWDAIDATELAFHKAGQHLALLGGETHQLRSTLEASQAKTTQRVSELEAFNTQRITDLIEKGQIVQLLQKEVHDLQENLIKLGEWAATIDKRPVRHALKKALVSARRAVLRTVPLTTQQRRAIRHRLVRRFGSLLRRRAYDLENRPVPCVSGHPKCEVIPGRRDIFIFAVIDWHFRFQRPQQLALSFTRQGHRVFYISNQFIDSGRSGYEIEQLDPRHPIYQVRLNVSGSPPIYHQPPTADGQTVILAGLGQLLFDYGVVGSYSIAHHPFWQPIMWLLPNSVRVYDCMDHHEGFGEVSQGILDAEKRLLSDSELVITTSSWLERFAKEYNPQVALIRNAGDYALFSQRPERVFADDQGRRVIGYYGAIAEWFDPEIIREVARVNPDTLILLIGSDTVNAREGLADLANVSFRGEVPYGDLPYYLYGFDVCALPFKVIPLTLATNPVKVYEYLAAGRPVVATELPELSQFGPHVVQASNPLAFAHAVRDVLRTPLTVEATESRRAFAREQTWEHRANAFEKAIHGVQLPRISVVVLTFNNLELTQTCIQSLLQRKDYENLEVIVVDNGSTDGTEQYLEALAAEQPGIKILLNRSNLGFAAGNNVGLSAATGEYLVLLNNDTEVTEGWALTLLRHLQSDPSIGIIGPVTDNIGNEARIQLTYSDAEQMREAARCYTLAHIGGSFEMRTLAFFCVMLPRRTYEKCGPLCVDYGLGFFEDDDYCRRVEKEGWSIRCAEDVFIHHHLSASFSKVSQSERDKLFQTNRAIYESKWGPWIPHSYR